MISAVITMEDNSVLIHSSKTKDVNTVFQPNFYETWVDNTGKQHINIKKIDEIHEPFVTKQNLTVLDAIDTFFQEGMKDKVNLLGFTHKLGILLHGKQGTGKTSLINHIVDKMVRDFNGIVFFCNNGNKLATAIGLAKQVREIQDNPIIFVGDEFERYCDNYEAEMKNLLDGNDSINNSLFLAATNYIDKVPKTLKERPSRFRVVLEITGVDDKNLITKMIKSISDRVQPSLFTDEEIDKVVADIKVVTLDEIKHICLNKMTNIMLPTTLNKPIGLSSNSSEKEGDEISKLIAEEAKELNVPINDIAAILRKVRDRQLGKDSDIKLEEVEVVRIDIGFQQTFESESEGLIKEG